MGSRKALLIVVGVLAMFALLFALAACAPAPPTTPTTTAPSTTTTKTEESTETTSSQTTTEEKAPGEPSATPTATVSTVLGKTIYDSGKTQAGTPIRFTEGSPAVKATGVAACAKCHGKNGKGIASLGPSLVKAVKDTFTTQALFNAAVTEGKDETGKPLSSRMPRFNLTSPQLESLYAYIKTL